MSNVGDSYRVPPMKIACGFYHSVAISNTLQDRRASQAISWGRNHHHVLGPLVGEKKEAPKYLKSPERVVESVSEDVPYEDYEVACGTNHTMFLRKRSDEVGGVLFASGLGNKGRLGMQANGSRAGSTGIEESWDTGPKLFQPRFNAKHGTRVLRVACGSDHTLCYATDGKLYAWGSNAEGQCGVASIGSASAMQSHIVWEPTAVVFPSDSGPVNHFATGSLHSLAFCNSSTVWAWGCGKNGRLGNGSLTNSPTPQQVHFVNPEAKGDAAPTSRADFFVAGGESHSAASFGNGSCYTWGDGSYGRLGNGEELDMLIPRKIATFVDERAKIHSIALGGFHSLFLDHEGGIWACGSGAPVGVLSSGDLSNVLLPRSLTRADQGKIFGRQRCTQIAAGMFHSLALMANGDMISWGMGAHGRLGIGSLRNSYEPQRVGITGYDFNQHHELVNVHKEAMQSLLQPAKRHEMRDLDPSVTMSLRHQYDLDKVKTFNQMQTIIKHEAKLVGSGGSISDKEAKLETDLKRMISDLLQIPEKEEALVQLEESLEQSRRNNHFLKGEDFEAKGQTPVTQATVRQSAPSDQHHDESAGCFGCLHPRRRRRKGVATEQAAAMQPEVSSEVRQTFPDYEELLLVLQQQTSYLAGLSDWITKDEEELFYTVVDALFADRSNRTRCLFFTMLRLMIDRETEASHKKNIDDVFDPNKSRAFNVFTRYVLSNANAKEFISLYFKITDKQECETLLDVFKKSTEGSVDTFALTLADYKASLQDDEKKNKDEGDFKAGFAKTLEKFRQFMEVAENGFRVVTQVKLPQHIQQLLAYALQALESQKLHTMADKGSPASEAVPMLRLFCLGVLVPILRNPEESAKFVSKRNGTKAEAKIASELNNDPSMVVNMKATADFLEHMLSSAESEHLKQVQLTVRLVKNALVKYLRTQADVEDSLQSQLIGESYLAHLSSTKSQVSLTTSNLLKLSEMVHSHMSKLRIMEVDALDAVVKRIPRWSAEVIADVEASEELHDFFLDPRFLFTRKCAPPVVLCQQSRCHLPPDLAGSLHSERLVVRLQQASGNDEENVQRVLERLLREVDDIEDDLTTFEEVKEEFERLRLFYNQQSPPNYFMEQDLQQGLRVIEEFISLKMRPQDLFKQMGNAMLQRERHLRELEQMRAVREDVHKQTTLYLKSLDGFRGELYEALKNYNMGYKKAAAPEFETRMENRRAFNPMPPYDHQPMETRTLDDLRKAKVILSVHPPFSSWQKNMRITLRVNSVAGTDALDIAVNAGEGKGRHLRLILRVPNHKVEDMKRMDKDEEFGLPYSPSPPVFTFAGKSLLEVVEATKKRSRSSP